MFTGKMKNKYLDKRHEIRDKILTINKLHVLDKVYSFIFKSQKSLRFFKSLYKKIEISFGKVLL
jgi:hypothetical protein